MAARKHRIRQNTDHSKALGSRTIDDFERLEAGVPDGDVSISDMQLENEESTLVEEGLNRHGFRHHFYARNS